MPALATHAIDFRTASYAGENTTAGPSGNADGGPQTADRTREGHFDVFEMGEVTGNQHGSADAIAAGDCAAIASAWSGGGYWRADAGADLTPPAGGVYGAEYVIDVARGTMFGVDALAIDGFRSAHTAPGAVAPDLDSASAQANGRYAAQVAVDGALRTLEYADPVDAVSALFMATTLEGSYARSPALGARTDWAANPALTPCLETSVLTFETSAGAGDIELPVSATGSRLTNATDPGAHVSRNFSGIELLPEAGSVSIDLAHDMTGAAVPSRALAAAANGDVLAGLPVLAFATTTWVNGNVAAGVLANYGASAAVRSRVACTNAGGPCR